MSDGKEFEGLEELFFQLSEYGNNLNVSTSLTDKPEVRDGYIKGLQHIINGGSIQDVVAEMNLCLDVEETDRAFGFMKALDYIKRYVQNSLEVIRINEVLGVETGTAFFVEVANAINKNIKF